MEINHKLIKWWTRFQGWCDLFHFFVSFFFFFFYSSPCGVLSKGYRCKVLYQDHRSGAQNQRHFQNSLSHIVTVVKSSMMLTG